MGAFEQKNYKHTVMKVLLVSVAYVLVFQVVTLIAFIIAGVYDHDLMHGERIEQIGYPYFPGVVCGLFIVFIATSPKLRRTFFKIGPAKMTWRMFGSLVCLIFFSQFLFTLYANGMEWLLNLFGYSAMDQLKVASGGSQTWSMFLYSGLLAPVVEELMFRGFVLRSILPYGTNAAILFSSFLFGLYHLNLMQTPFAFLMGIVLGFVAVEYGLKWSMLLHAFNNTVLGDGLSKLIDLLPTNSSEVVTDVLFLVGAIIAIIVLVQKRQLIKDWCQAHRPRRGEFKLAFLNLPNILVTIVAIALMLIQISPK